MSLGHETARSHPHVGNTTTVTSDQGHFQTTLTATVCDKSATNDQHGATRQDEEPVGNHKHVLFNRLSKRYLNIRCKEYIKKMKRKLKDTEKKKEHRKQIATHKSTAKTSVTKQLLSSMLLDKTSQKQSSHFLLKSIAAKGKDEFSGLTKPELHFLFHLYKIPFIQSKNKKNFQI